MSYPLSPTLLLLRFLSALLQPTHEETSVFHVHHQQTRPPLLLFHKFTHAFHVSKEPRDKRQVQCRLISKSLRFWNFISFFFLRLSSFYSIFLLFLLFSQVLFRFIYYFFSSFFFTKASDEKVSMILFISYRCTVAFRLYISFSLFSIFLRPNLVARVCLSAPRTSTSFFLSLLSLSLALFVLLSMNEKNPLWSLPEKLSQTSLCREWDSSVSTWKNIGDLTSQPSFFILLKFSRSATS